MEKLNIKDFKLYTAGYVLPDGDIIMMDEYHGEDQSMRDKHYAEFSNTHPEEDTCVRIYEPLTKAQKDSLEIIIDKYLDNESYCKVEIWKNRSTYTFYKIYSLYDGACDYEADEIVGNWTGYKLIQIIDNYFKNNKNPLYEEYLIEKKRLELISKSRKGEKYKGKSTGRWEAKSKCKVASTVKDYNKMDMDTFWKKDYLKFGVRVQGETDNYIVNVEFSNVINRIQQKVKANKNLFELNLIYKSLAEALNSSDVKVACSCPDHKFRFAYWATKNNFNAGPDENREAKITNPTDSLGDGCKHILCVLNNADWLHKIASVINNYVAYIKDNMENLYGKYIFPKIYGIDYQKALQVVADAEDENAENNRLKSDEATLNLSNALGKERGKFKKGSNKNPITQQRREQQQKEDEQNSAQKA